MNHLQQEEKQRGGISGERRWLGEPEWWMGGGEKWWDRGDTVTVEPTSSLKGEDGGRLHHLSLGLLGKLQSGSHSRAGGEPGVHSIRSQGGNMFKKRAVDLVL